MSEKKELREQAELRRRTAAAAAPRFADRIAAFADDLGLVAGAVVSGYWAFRDEADPRALMLALAAKGQALALPAVAARDTPLRFHAWKEGDVMHRVAFGLTEPLPTAQVVQPSVLLVPLLAFDAEGYRLGYGGGYYDRTLGALRAERSIFAIGVAYAGQEVAALPHAAHDERLDAVVTENGMRRFRS